MFSSVVTTIGSLLQETSAGEQWTGGNTHKVGMDSLRFNKVPQHSRMLMTTHVLRADLQESDTSRLDQELQSF